MKTKILEDLAKAKRFYGHHTAVSEMGGLTVRICGKNVGNPGKPNVAFHLDSWEAPLFSARKALYNQTAGLKFSELICELYPDFSKDSRVCFGSRILKDTREANVMHFFLTMQPEEVRYLLIADRQNLIEPHMVTNDIKKLAKHYYLGQAEVAEQKDTREVCYWDYYILPIGFKYHEGAAHDLPEEASKRQLMIRELFSKIFGEVTAPAKTAKDMEVEGQVMAKIDSTAKPVKKSQTLNPVECMHYDDGVYRTMSFVIDTYGRMLQPKMKDDKATSFIDAAVACTDVWDIVPKDNLVLEYIQRGFSTDPIYKLVRCPVDKNDKQITPTSLQLDRVAILEAQLTSARKAKAAELGVSDILIYGAPETWSRQLRKRAELAR